MEYRWTFMNDEHNGCIMYIVYVYVKLNMFDA